MRAPVQRLGAWRVLVLLAATVACGPGCARSPGESIEQTARRQLDRGDIALALRRPEQAERAYRSALAVSPHDGAALHGLARAQVAQGKFDQALISYGELAEREPEAFAAVRDGEFCPLWVRSAEAQLARGQSRLALESLERSKAQACRRPAPDDVLARALLAEAERARGADHAQAASELYRAAAEANPSRVEAFREASVLLLDQGRREEALVLLSEALLRHPANRGLQTLMVEALGIRVSEPGPVREESGVDPAAPVAD